jgi:hypothetical protein
MAASKVRGVPVRDRLVSLKAGTLEVFPAKSTAKIAGKPFGKAELVEKLDALLAPFDKAELARKRYALAVAEKVAVTPEATRFVKAACLALQNEHGTGAEVLLKYGIEGPKPRRALTPEQKVAVAEKSRATRAARHTMGHRQRLAIKAPVAGANPSQTNTIVLTEAPPSKELNGLPH